MGFDHKICRGRRALRSEPEHQIRRKRTVLRLDKLIVSALDLDRSKALSAEHLKKRQIITLVGPVVLSNRAAQKTLGEQTFEENPRLLIIVSFRSQRQAQ